jgi:serine/threonine protein kinase
MSGDFLSDVTTVKEISEGSYGKVYEICKGKYDKDTCDGELYAEKVYIGGEPEFNEIDVLSRFEHPHLLKAVKSHIDSKGNFHLILPLADKPNYDLKKVIEKGKLSLDKAITYIYQIISAVGFLHSQEYYHCDIKPQNILMFNDNCVLADYGFTYQSSYNMKTCGTVGYASPQAWYENENFDWVYYKEKINQIQSDIYSIGAVFYECLLGKQLNDYTLYKKDSDEANDDEAYQQTEERILKVINFMKEKKELRKN